MKLQIIIALLSKLGVTWGRASAEADVALHGQALPSAFPTNSGFHPVQHSAAAHHPAQHRAGGGHHPAQHAAAGGGHHASHGASGHHASHGNTKGHHASHGGGSQAHHASRGGGSSQAHHAHHGGSSYSAPAAPAYGAPAPAPSHHKEGICTDVSYVKPVDFVPGDVCCSTKVIEPKCTETKKTVKRFVTETVCELIPTPKCQMTPCPVDATVVEHYEESFEPWECELRPKILYHHKTLPVCHNVSKPICVEEWKTDYTTGQRYKVVTDNCEHAFWEECEDQTKKVPFHTMESQCWKAKEIWYEKCREVSKPINMMCWSCVADAVPKCDTVEVEKQIEVMEKSCEPQTEQMCNPPKKQPTQEKVHQEKCLHHDDKGKMHESTHPAPLPPTYSG